MRESLLNATSAWGLLDDTERIIVEHIVEDKDQGPSISLLCTICTGTYDKVI